MFELKGLGKAPIAHATITRESGKNHVKWNVDFEEITRLSGPRLKFSHALPLYGAAISNRLLWSAAQLSCDLYVSSPLGALVGDKLAEAGRRLAIHHIVDELTAEVDFPEIRTLVNDGRLPFSEILRIRTKAQTFRRWLQDEGERDRNAILAHHRELAVTAGLSAPVRKALSIFGILGGGALGAVLSAGHETLGTALGGAAGSYLTDLATRFRDGWKPVVFGQWLQERIRQYLGRSVR